MEPKRKLNKAEQDKIVSKTNTGGLGASVGFPGFKQFPAANTYPTTKFKVEKVRTIRKRG